MTTENEILEMIPGFNLDKLVVEQILGLEYLRVEYFDDPGISKRQEQLESWLDSVGIPGIGDYYLDVRKNGFIACDVFRPSEDPRAAWEIVKAARPGYFGLGHDMVHRISGSGIAEPRFKGWWCEWGTGPLNTFIVREQKTAMIAICKAAVSSKIGGKS